MDKGVFVVSVVSWILSPSEGMLTSACSSYI